MVTTPQPTPLSPEQTKKMNLLLYKEIDAYIRILNKSDSLSLDEIHDMTASLCSFVEEATKKYLKGKAEHGGMLKDRDLDKEISAEIYDLFWYNEARKTK